MVDTAAATRPTIVVVGMLASPHLARWLHARRNESVNVILFASTPFRAPHRLIEELVDGKYELNCKVWSYRFATPPTHSFVQRFTRERRRARELQKVLSQTNPALIHAVELQHGGYIAARALRAMNSHERPPLSIVNWGSDIFWFQRFSRHRKKLSNLLSMADLYSCECNRDVSLAKNFGFTGISLNPSPNCGGVEPIDSEGSRPLTDRNSIAIKGYSQFVGKAHWFLFAWLTKNPKTKDLSLEIFSASLVCRALGNLIAKRNHNVTVHCYSPGSLNQHEMAELFSRSRAYVGFSQSDGLSTSLLEALAAGAICSQTSSACLEDLTQRGFSLIALDYRKPFHAVQELLRAYHSPEEFQSQVTSNQRLAQQLLTPESVAALAPTIGDLISQARSTRR